MTKPILEETGFGYINVDGKRISHDIVIRLDGEVKKRKKKLSKEIYGTSHKISLAEAEYIFQEDAKAWNESQGNIIGLFHITC